MSHQGRTLRARDPRTGRLFRIVGKARAFRQPPPALLKAKLDNLTLVPGSLLSYQAHWQALANELAPGDVLIVLPAADRPPRKTFEKVAALMRAKGRHVTTLLADRHGPARVKP